MKYSEEQLNTFRTNDRTMYHMKQFDVLLVREKEALELRESDASMRELAEEELASIQKEADALYAEMERILKVTEEEESKPYGVLLEVRAGVGGEEAALFAEELAHMYQRFAEREGWTATLMSESRASQGGYKEEHLSLLVLTYEKLRYETGVHRVQRVPATEKMGRIHTSTASVAILPIRKKPSNYHQSHRYRNGVLTFRWCWWTERKQSGNCGSSHSQTNRG